MKEIKALGGGVLHIGRTGEHEAVRVVFSLLPFKAAFSGGTPALLVRRAGDDAAYPVPLTVDGDAAYWTVTSADTEKAGFGQCELQWYAGKTLAKSAKLDFLVAQALDGGAEPPDAPSKRWFDGLDGKSETCQSSAQRKRKIWSQPSMRWRAPAAWAAAEPTCRWQTDISAIAPTDRRGKI